MCAQKIPYTKRSWSWQTCKILAKIHSRSTICTESVIIGVRLKVAEDLEQLVDRPLADTRQKTENE
jgi:hypothetical protein